MSGDKKIKRFIGITATMLGTVFAGMEIWAKIKKDNSVYKNEPSEQNPMEGKKVVFIEDDNDLENADGVRGHLEAIGDSDYHPGFYEKYVKRALDVMLSFGGLVILSPVFIGLSIAIFIDDPGPIFFTQKRLGQNKKYFKLHKFRSMKMSTPHDVPTHMLDNPDQYITKVGKFIRTHSLDELPQIWDIFVNNMSVIGPRPGLWNQDVLTAERDKYGANDVKPGLTGWAQINGRDELEIPDKAKLDGEYAQKIGFMMDLKCFLGSIGVFGGDDSVVEGGTGTKFQHNVEKRLTTPKIAVCHTNLDYSIPKKILVAGTGSYIGDKFKEYMTQFDNYIIDEVNTISDEWKNKDFSLYDVVYDVAGIVHVKEDDSNRELYYSVNRDLAVAIAQKAKCEGVKQFVYLSSMSVYGLNVGRISKNTVLNPVNAYGKSKAEAEELLWQLADDRFIVSIVRPPMVYGKNCKGNYQTLKKFVLKFGVFPKYQNERSMIYIDNLSSAVRGIIHNEVSGVYFPQNADYVVTCNMAKKIAELNKRKIWETTALNGLIRIMLNNVEILKKVFGTLVYEKDLNIPIEWIVETKLEKTMEKTEKEKNVEEKNVLPVKVLVLMSTYNGEEYIAQQIESIIGQVGIERVDILIRDDGSTDSTYEILELYEKKYPNNIRIIQGDNIGYNNSFFELIRRADGYDYYSFSDQDDVWLLDKLFSACKCLESRDKEKVLLYACPSYLVEDDLKPYGTTRMKKKNFTLYNTIIQNICPGHNQVFNNKLLNILKKDIDVKKLYVYDSWVTNIAMLYGEICFEDQPHTYYRQHRGNQLGSGKSMLGQLLTSMKRVKTGDGNKYRKQIQYFTYLNSVELKKQGKFDELERFLNANTFIKKCLYLPTSKLYRQRLVETIVFKMAVLLGEY